MTMQRLVPVLLLVVSFFGSFGQDRLFFINGSSKTATVVQIWPDFVKVRIDNKERSIDKSELLLIEFENGATITCTQPAKDVMYDPQGHAERQSPEKPLAYRPTSLFSVNSLALCNADASVFYEKLLGKLFGVGAMGAYNFNSGVTILNASAALLPGAKKKYDLGLFANYYFDPPDNTQETTIYTGILVKYMRLRFLKTQSIQGPPGSATQIGYTAAEGVQLCPMLTGGTHTQLENGLFFRTLIGLGMYKLSGDYFEEYNYRVNGGSGTRSSSLVSAYLGFNLGFIF